MTVGWSGCTILIRRGPHGNLLCQLRYVPGSLFLFWPSLHQFIGSLDCELRYRDTWCEVYDTYDQDDTPPFAVGPYEWAFDEYGHTQE